MLVNNASIHEDLNLIKNAALEAAEIALRHFGKDPEICYKGQSRSPVTEADLEIDQYLNKTLMAARPNYGWLSEETKDNSERLSATRTFVVDPIDGTRAFIDGTDQWCISIGIVENGRPIHGVLVAPVRKQVFLASTGQGASLNDAVYTQDNLPDINQPERVILPREVIDHVLPDYKQNVEQIGGARSLALRIVGLLEQNADGIFVRKNSRDWDMAAADLIINEAGYKLVDLDLNDVVYNEIETRHGVLFATRPSYIPVMRTAFVG